MNQEIFAIQPDAYTDLPWELSGEGYILNYWLSPHFLHQFKAFGLTPSKYGRFVQVMLVRYHQSPVGPYDELLLLEHASKGLTLQSNIPKIYVSTQASIDEGRFHWGIPKELAKFEWQESLQKLNCEISVADEKLTINLNLSKIKSLPSISSTFITTKLFQIQQRDEKFQYNFTPSFEGSISLISKAHWEANHHIFPDFSQATFLKGIYSTDFNLIFPEALKKNI